MIIQKYEKNGLIGKIFKVQEGYYFKIYKNKNQIAQMYYYAFDEETAENELFKAFDIICKEKVKLL